MVLWLCGAAVLYSTVVVRHVATACCISHAVVIILLLDLMCFELFKVRCV